MPIIIRSIFNPWTFYNNPLRVRLVQSVSPFYAKSYIDILRERLSQYYTIRRLQLLDNYRIRFVGVPLKITSFWGGAKKGEKAFDYAKQLTKIVGEVNDSIKKGGAKKSSKKETEEKYGIELVEIVKK